MLEPLQRSILDALNGGLIVLGGDKRIALWNAWMVGASGYTSSQAEGRTLEAVFPARDLSRLAAATSSALLSGVSTLLTHALHPELIPLKTRSGRRLLHDITVTAVPGQPRAMCLIHVSDVSMAVRRERYLRARQNARYDAVLASAPDVILTLDSLGVVRLANPAAVLQFGFTEAELVNHPATLLFDNSGAWQKVWTEVVAGGKPQLPVELVARRKDGSVSHVEVSASRWEDESHVFVTVILRDINERIATEAALRASEQEARAAATAFSELNSTLERRVEERTSQLLKAEDALRQSQKMEAIGQLTGGIAHDFNNLLQGIIGALDVIQKRIDQGRINEVDRFLRGAAESAERASALTHRLLAFARRQPVDPRPADMNALIGGIEELLRRSIGEKVDMQVERTEELWLVRCDVNQMENALLNLAINARDAMPDGGTLTIRTENRTLDAAQAAMRDLRPGAHVCLTISDTGIGMPSDVKARAFDPFFTTKPIGEGTGLGLSMISGFVRQSQGSVQISSEVGQGTSIEICLPRFEGCLEREATGTASSGSRTQENEVVLVVEDEPIVRLLVVEVLNELGYRALEAADGGTALRILESPQRIDLLVTDIGLPDINGRQMADRARAKRRNLKILFMTGYAENAASSGFLEKGMEIIGKPFTMDKLAGKVSDILTPHRPPGGSAVSAFE